MAGERHGRGLLCVNRPLEQAPALPECLQSSIHRAMSCRCTTVQLMLRSNNPKLDNILAACFDMAAHSSGRTREVQN